MHTGATLTDWPFRATARDRDEAKQNRGFYFEEVDYGMLDLVALAKRRLKRSVGSDCQHMSEKMDQSLFLTWNIALKEFH